MNSRGWVLFCALAALATAAQAQMYKCVDERGVTHYSDKPSPGCQGKEVDIQPLPPTGGKVEPRSRDAAREDAEFQRRRIERERVEAKEQAVREAQQRKCAQLRSEIGRIRGARRVIEKYAENGERIYMDDAAREKRVAELSEQLRACP
jgi:hypothetical protein